MPESNEQHEQLLTAYLDGELGPQERAQAEALIRENPEYSELMEQWRDDGIALRSMPQFKLDSSFSDRVLNSLEFGNARANGSADGGNSHWTGLAAIASLAAMLLLTLFVFPNFADKPVAKLDALPDQPSDVVEKIDDVAPEMVRTPIVRVPRHKMLNTNPSGTVPVGAISNQPAVEQVLVVKVDSVELDEVQQILIRNSVKVDKQVDKQSAEDDNEIEAIYLVSTPSKMRRVIGQIADELSASVTTFPLPSSSLKAENSARLIPLKFKGDAEAKEIAELDQWFGLSSKEDDDKPVRFLLLIER